MLSCISGLLQYHKTPSAHEEQNIRGRITIRQCVIGSRALEVISKFRIQVQLRRVNPYKLSREECTRPSNVEFRRSQGCLEAVPILAKAGFVSHITNHQLFLLGASTSLRVQLCRFSFSTVVVSLLLHTLSGVGLLRLAAG